MPKVSASFLSQSSASALWEEIQNHYLAKEEVLVSFLMENHQVTQAVQSTARNRALDLVSKLQKGTDKESIFDKLMKDFSLATGEGQALMSLTESLFRTPDLYTKNALIKDKIGSGDWQNYHNKEYSRSTRYLSRLLGMTHGILGSSDLAAPSSGALSHLLRGVSMPFVRFGTTQVVSKVASEFVFSETIDRALKERKTKKQRVHSFDMLGEAARTHNDAQRYYELYKHAIIAVGQAESSIGEIFEKDSVSVKLSALYPRYEWTHNEDVLEELYKPLERLALLAKRHNVSLTIDAEESGRLELSLLLFERLLALPALSGWSGLGLVIQAYQKRAPFVCEWVIAKAKEHQRKVPVRLVKGAYWDTEVKHAQVEGLEDYPVFTAKSATDLCYWYCAERLLREQESIYPQFATHNAGTVALILELARGRQFEMQCLYGMGQRLYDLVQEDTKVLVRIYAPVGGYHDLLPYLIRRILENGASNSFVHQMAQGQISLEELVESPLHIIQSEKNKQKHYLPLPENLYREDGRDNSRGISLEQSLSLGDLVSQVQSKRRYRVGHSFVNGQEKVGIPRPVCCPWDKARNVGEVSYATAELVDEALTIAQGYVPTWSSKPVSERAQILRQIAQTLEKDKYTLISILIDEAGKTYADGIAEIREAIEFCDYYALQAETNPALDNVSARGVFACISPWNFPVAIFLGQVVAALVTGNTVVAKPSELTSLVAVRVAELMIEAGLPSEAFHLVIGDGKSVGTALTVDQRVQGVCFTGSTAVAQEIQKVLYSTQRAEVPLIAETGGLNAMIVDSTALLEQVTDDIMASAFQSAGQRCSALRVLCVQEDIYDRLKEMIKGAMEALVVGEPTSVKTDVPSVIDGAAFSRISSYIEAEKKRTSVFQVKAPSLEQGYFIPPTLIELPDIQAFKQEVFGPVLHLVSFKADEMDSLLESIHDKGYGLTLSLQTRRKNLIDFVQNKAQVGNIYINRNQIGAVVGVQPFGGIGLSGTGPKAGGPLYLRRFVQASHLEQRLQDTKLSFYDRSVKLSAYGTAFQKAHQAFRALNVKKDFIPSLKRVLADLGSDEPEFFKTIEFYMDFCGEDYLRDSFVYQELTSPTGEDNKYRLHGRGVVLSLAQSIPEVYEHIALAILQRNSIVCFVNQENKVALEKLSKALNVFQPDMLILIELVDEKIPSSILKSSFYQALMVFVPKEVADGKLAEILSHKKGALVPLILNPEESWRLVTERSVSDNITAFGGNVQLLMQDLK